MSCKTHYNVFLSGGGMKGAYQYGFFKKLYEHYPNFPIKRVYAVSVGALNAIPILLKRTDILDTYWSNKDIKPLDAISNDWDFVKSTKYKNLLRAMAYFTHGSLFRSVNISHLEKLLNTFSSDELNYIRKKLIIISYDSKNQKPVFSRCTSIRKICEAIKTSTCFPGLYKPESDIIDGIFYDFDKFHEKDAWLYIDLQINKESRNNLYVFRPKVTMNPIVNIRSCLIVNIDELVQNGSDDADIFLEKISYKNCI
jgi:predicted acylesterase/phospholipase RssA